MQIWKEPVRGQTVDRNLFSLSGLEVARTFVRDESGRVPIFHLYGPRPTQVGAGSGVFTMPASGWLMHANGQVELSGLAATTVSYAALTVADPGHLNVLRSLSYAQVRLVSSRNRTFVARADVVRNTQRYAFLRYTVEDGEGRLIANGTGTVELAPMDPPPDQDAIPRAVQHPVYPTPDPHARPLPLEVTADIQRWVVGDLSVRQGVVDGSLSPPPIAQLLGIETVSLERGSQTSELITSPWLCEIDDSVGPGVVAFTLCDALGGSSAGLLQPGVTFGILSYDLQLYRKVPADGRRLRCVATSSARADDLLYASGQLTDGDEVVASASMLGLILPASVSTEAPTRTLATVLFTDIVGSTESGVRMGDARWRELLDQHHELTARTIDAHKGRQVNTTGDGVIAVFDSPTEAVRCGREIARCSPELGIEVRVSVHAGEVERRGADVSGQTVNVASRLLSFGGGGEVLVSRTVKDLTGGAGFTFEPRGTHELKGIPDAWELFAVTG